MTDSPKRPDPHEDHDADYVTGDGGVTRDMLDLRPVVPRTVANLYESRPKLNPNQAIGAFLERVHLQERHGHLRVVDDSIGAHDDHVGRLGDLTDPLDRGRRTHQQALDVRVGQGLECQEQRARKQGRDH